MKLRHLLLSILFCWISVLVQARDTTRISHRIGADLRPSLIIPTHSFYRGVNPIGKPLKYGGSVHLKYSFSLHDDHLHPLTSQGLGISVNTFGTHEHLGTPVGIYLFQHVPILKLNDRWSIDYEWNFGLSFGWRHASGTDDYSNRLIGSSVNAYIGVSGLLSYRMNRLWTLSFGPEYTHFSNGDTAFPNGGANTVNFRVGVTRDFRTVGHNDRHPVTFRKLNDMVYDLVLYGSWRADRALDGTHLVILNDAFAVCGFNLNPLYRFNDIISAGPSLDFIYDRSANLIIEDADESSYSFPSPWKQFACGLSARGELSMPIFSVNLGIGYNLLHWGDDLKGLYGIFALKTFLSDKFFLHVGYRLSNVLYAHNLMFGLGLRFGGHSDD